MDKQNVFPSDEDPSSYVTQQKFQIKQLVVLNSLLSKKQKQNYQRLLSSKLKHTYQPFFHKKQEKLMKDMIERQRKKDEIKRRKFRPKNRTQQEKLLNQFKFCNSCFHRKNTVVPKNEEKRDEKIGERLEKLNKFVDINYRDLLPNFPGDRFVRGKLFNNSMKKRKKEKRYNSLTQTNLKVLSDTLTNTEYMNQTENKNNKGNNTFSHIYPKSKAISGRIDMSQELPKAFASQTLNSKKPQQKLAIKRKNFNLFKSTFNLPKQKSPYKFSRFQPTLITNRQFRTVFFPFYGAQPMTRKDLYFKKLREDQIKLRSTHSNRMMTTQLISQNSYKDMNQNMFNFSGNNFYILDINQREKEEPQSRIMRARKRDLEYYQQKTEFMQMRKSTANLRLLKSQKNQ